MKSKQLLAIRLLEEKLRGASPSECGKITKELVKLKDDWMNA
jgi:hypothetical protein